MAALAPRDGDEDVLKLIVVPLDGSPLSERVVPYAAHLCRVSGASVELVRAAVSPSAAVVTNAAAARIAAAHQAQVLKEAEEELGRVARQLRDQGITTNVVARIAGPVELITQTAQAENADLILISVHGRSGLTRYVLGSFSDELLRRAELPLFLVPPSCLGQWPTDRRLRLLVPLDGSALGEEALGPAKELASTLGADLLLLRSVHSDHGGQDVSDGTAYLEGLAAALHGEGFEVMVQVTTEAPQAAILKVMSDQGADLIVMATHGRSGLARVLLGSVAADVVAHSTVPLLLIRPPAIHAAHAAL